MRKKKLTNKEIKNLIGQIVATYEGDSGVNFIDATDLPVRDKIVNSLELLLEVLFPGYTGKRVVTKSNINFILGDMFCQIYTELSGQIERALRHGCRLDNCENCDCQSMACGITSDLLKKIPSIRKLLKGDVKAAFAGDPAAQSLEEVVISYPGILAITTYRIAHELCLNKVPLVPRIMTEWAHTKTGIDINAGAEIGKNFFIDHGTGIVVGETTVIGNNVKIYQGVTLGALAPAKGQSIRGLKRHPTIEDNVTIYAEATILGDVTIGKGSVVGGNVWLKESVPAGVTVSMHSAELVYTKKSK